MLLIKYTLQFGVLVLILSLFVGAYVFVQFVQLSKLIRKSLAAAVK